VPGSSGCSASTGKGSARFAKLQAAPKPQALDGSCIANKTNNTRSISELPRAGRRRACEVVGASRPASTLVQIQQLATL
jgi:hypothetical protein